MYTIFINNTDYDEEKVISLRFIMGLIWSLLISGVISYVLTSMAGEPFSLTYVFVIAAFLFVAITFLGEGILKEKKE